MVAADPLKPFLPSRPSGPVFIGLNALRALSIVALLLVISANIVTMVEWVNAGLLDTNFAADRAL
jgi:hypothetical protein